MTKKQIVLTLLNLVMWSTASKFPFQKNVGSFESSALEQSLLTSTSRQISPEIVNDLIEVADLEPQAAIDAVFAEHILFDSDFRKAVDFLKSSQFKAMLDKLAEEPEIVELLNFLQILVPAASENELSVPYLEIVLLEAMAVREQRPRLTKRSAAYDELADAAEIFNLHSFTGAVRELLAYFPHDKFRNLINEKRRKSALFASFYKALRSAEFRPRVATVLASKNLSPYIALLNSHSIDVKALEPIAFDVISWGPTV